MRAAVAMWSLEDSGHLLTHLPVPAFCHATTCLSFSHLCLPATTTLPSQDTLPLRGPHTTYHPAPVCCTYTPVYTFFIFCHPSTLLHFSLPGAPKTANRHCLQTPAFHAAATLRTSFLTGKIRMKEKKKKEDRYGICIHDYTSWLHWYCYILHILVVFVSHAHTHCLRCIYRSTFPLTKRCLYIHAPVVLFCAVVRPTVFLLFLAVALFQSLFASLTLCRCLQHATLCHTTSTTYTFTCQHACLLPACQPATAPSCPCHANILMPGCFIPLQTLPSPATVCRAASTFYVVPFHPHAPALSGRAIRASAGKPHRWHRCAHGWRPSRIIGVGGRRAP